MTKSSETAAQVIVYSTPWCAFCKTEKQYLEHLGVPFVAKDVEESEAAMQELKTKLSGNFSGVPITDIDGEIVHGFDRAKIDSLLKEKGLLKA